MLFEKAQSRRLRGVLIGADFLHQEQNQRRQQQIDESPAHAECSEDDKRSPRTGKSIRMKEKETCRIQHAENSGEDHKGKRDAFLSLSHSDQQRVKNGSYGEGIEIPRQAIGFQSLQNLLQKNGLLLRLKDRQII